MSPKPRELTGRTVLIIAVSAFAVVLGANLTMLWAATGSFPGLVVENSYRAGVGWDERSQAQEALGWDSRVIYEPGRIAVALTDAQGAPVDGLSVTAEVGRPAEATVDRSLALAPRDGRYAAPLSLDPGRWRVVLSAEGTDGARYRAVAALFVPEAD